MSCDALNNYLETESGRISGSVAKRGRVKSLWYTLLESDWWKDGSGHTANNVVAQRTIPNLSAITTDAGGDGWTTITGTDGGSTGSGCRPLVGTISNRNLTNSASLKEITLVSDELCLTKVRAAYNPAEQIARAKKNFEDNVIDLWAAKNRREYINAIPDENKLVFVNGGLEAGGAGDFFVGNAPDSQVHQDILDEIRQRMIHDGAGEEGAYGMVDGDPIFLVVMSHDQQRALIKGNDDVRQDYRYAEPKALLKPFGIGRTYAGLYHAIDRMAPRYNLVGGAWVEVPFYVEDEDGIAVVNPDYRTAEAEDIIFYHPQVVKKLMQKPISGFGSQTNFKAWNFAGETSWINEYDKECNRFRENGYWAARLRAAYLATNPSYGYAVRVLRCNNVYGQTACPVS